MLTDRLGLPAPVAALFAHVGERWDGKGEPGRTRRDEIPLPVRLVHVARDAARPSPLKPREVKPVMSKVHHPRLVARRWRVDPEVHAVKGSLPRRQTSSAVYSPRRIGESARPRPRRLTQPASQKHLSSANGPQGQFHKQPRRATVKAAAIARRLLRIACPNPILNVV